MLRPRHKRQLGPRPAPLRPALNGRDELWPHPAPPIINTPAPPKLPQPLRARLTAGPQKLVVPNCRLLRPGAPVWCLDLTSQGGTAADPITAEHIADWINLIYYKFSPDEQDDLCGHLQDLVDSHVAQVNGGNGNNNGNGNGAIDQPPLRLPQGGGPWTRPASVAVGSDRFTYGSGGAPR